MDAVLTVVDAHHVTQHLDEIKPEGVVNEAGEWKERETIGRKERLVIGADEK